jgi:hypothetical protein
MSPGTLTWAIVMTSWWIVAERSVTLSSLPVHARAYLSIERKFPFALRVLPGLLEQSSARYQVEHVPVDSGQCVPYIDMLGY